VVGLRGDVLRQDAATTTGYPDGVLEEQTEVGSAGVVKVNVDAA